MDTFNMEMSILNDEYEISMLMNESNYFYSLIQDNTIINESFGSKVKEIINKFVEKIKEIWNNIKRWFKEFKVNILMKICDNCISKLEKLGWSVTREPGEGTTYANQDAFDDEDWQDSSKFFADESVIYEEDKSIKKAMMDNKKYYYYASKDILDFVNEEIKKSKEIFKSYDEIYDLMNEYTNLSKESLEYIKLYEKYEYDWDKIQTSSQFAKIEKLNEKLLKTQKEIEDTLSTESKDINIQKFDKSSQLGNSRENNKNQRSSQIRLSSVSGDKSFYNDPVWDVTSTTKNITPIYKDYFNTMIKKLDLIERYVDNWIKQILTSIKTLERQALSYKDDTNINAPVKMINQNIALYNKYLNQYQDLQKCIKGANKLLISQIMFINTNVVKAITHNIMFRKANKNIFDYKDRQLRGEVGGTISSRGKISMREPDWKKMV